MISPARVCWAIDKTSWLIAYWIAFQVGCRFDWIKCCGFSKNRLLFSDTCYPLYAISLQVGLSTGVFFILSTRLHIFYSFIGWNTSIWFGMGKVGSCQNLVLYMFMLVEVGSGWNLVVLYMFMLVEVESLNPVVLYMFMSVYSST